MALLVTWYGDLPDRVFWFVERTHWPWSLIAGLAFVFGSVVPIFALFLGRWRGSPRALRTIAAITLVGILLFDMYLVAPAFNALAIGAGSLAAIAIGALFVAFLAMPWAQAPLRRRRLVHGR